MTKKFKRDEEELKEIYDKVKEYIKYEMDVDVNRNCRQQKQIDARCIYSKILYDYYYFTYQQIADSIGKNHGTIINSLRMFDYNIRPYKRMYAMYSKILLALDITTVEKERYLELTYGRYEVNDKAKKLFDLVNKIPDEKLELTYKMVEVLLETC